MTAVPLKDAIRAALWQVADRHPFVRSVTLTGSFVEAPSLDGISDIDCVVVVDWLNAERYDTLVGEFDAALRGLLAEEGFEFRVNPTLGPLKFNGPKLAVLHLMLYSQRARVDHAHNSPFTCLDWQRSGVHRKRSLADVYPVFGLQPRHFLGSRRSIKDYLADLRAGVVSYRELVCSAVGYEERKHGKPMTVRDRHEFAYHVMKFLMSNLLKLLTRTNTAFDTDALPAEYFARFPDGAEVFVPFFRTLAAKKRAIDFADPVPDLEPTLERFAAVMEGQFRNVFVETATRHVVTRHAPTRLNGGNGEGVIFQGRTDEPVVATPDADWQPLADTVHELNLSAAFASPTKRARQTLARLRAFTDLPFETLDERLHEIDYGELECRTVGDARRIYPDVFAAWEAGEDPRLPGGESTADVLARVEVFTRDRWESATADSLTCTHNVLLRCLVGATLGVPRSEWHRLRVPHLGPVTFVQTREYGRFVNLPDAVERQLFASWVPQAEAA